MGWAQYDMPGICPWGEVTVPLAPEPCEPQAISPSAPWDWALPMLRGGLHAPLTHINVALGNFYGLQASILKKVPACHLGERDNLKI